MGQYTFNHNDNSIMNLLNDMIWYGTERVKTKINKKKTNEWMESSWCNWKLKADQKKKKRMSVL